MSDLILIIPNELFSMILDILDISSIYSLGSTSKKYKQSDLIRLMFDKKLDLKEFPYPTSIARIHLKEFPYPTSIQHIHLDAIFNEHLDLFKWLVTKSEISRDIVKHFTYIKSAIKNNCLPILKYLYTIKCPWSPHSSENFEIAVSNGHINIVKYLWENGCELTHWSCYFAAENNHVEVLKYLHEQGCRLGIDSCNVAAKNGGLEVLKYLYANGFTMNKSACANAAANGQLEVLKYLHENGCPWDDYACEYAAENNRFDVMKYLYENDCPGSHTGSKTLFDNPVYDDNGQIIKYVYQVERNYYNMNIQYLQQQ